MIAALALMPSGFVVLDEHLNTVCRGLMLEDGKSLVEMTPGVLPLDALAHVGQGMAYLLEMQCDAVGYPPADNPLEEHGL